MADKSGALTGKISSANVQKINATYGKGSQKKPVVKKGGDLRSK